MASAVIQGSFLVLVSWIFIVFLVSAYGRWLAVVVSQKTTITSDHTFRVGLWWGLTLVAATTLTLSLLAPLGDTTAASVLLIGGLVLAVLGLALAKVRRATWRRPTKAVIAWLSVAWLGMVYLSIKALAPVTNYDSGLYHLGSIRYASDFSAIPGIANLYFPFGYANAQFPLAAVMGNGPWEGIGYRLLNGAILMLVLLDLTSRLLNRRWSWGTFTLLFGVSATFIPMVAMADDMVTSPTADTSVMLLTLIAASYLADALQFRKSTQLDAATAIVVAGLTVAFRPTMMIFALGVVLVATTFVWRKRKHLIDKPRVWFTPAALLLVVAFASLLRDRVLSGWLFYPLSTFPLPVPWRAQDPSPWRIGTLAAARDPNSQDGFQTAHSFEWLGSWFARLPSQWETWFLLVGLITALLAVATAWRADVMTGVWTRLVIALVPSALAIGFWFIISPPSFRFIWGPIFALLVIPLGIAFAQLRSGQIKLIGGYPGTRFVLLVSALCIGSVTAFSVVERNQLDTITEERSWRLGPLSIPYAITPVPLPETVPVDVGNGLVVLTPAFGDQCWDNYPLCVYYTGQSVVPRGQSIQDGFAHE